MNDSAFVFVNGLGEHVSLCAHQNNKYRCMAARQYAEQVFKPVLEDSLL